MRRLAICVATALALSACTASSAEAELDPNLVEAALDICPVMWQWQLAMGAAMNEMSQAAFDEEDSQKRLAIYLQAMEDARAINDGLRARLSGVRGSRYDVFFASEITQGLEDSDDVIDDTEALVHAAYVSGAPTYQEIVPPIFLAFEKVIDLAKPELASYGDPSLIPAFMSVPQCQHGVKDANDGVPRYVPLEPEPQG